MTSEHMLETTSAFITPVGPDHTIVLPNDIAVGATVSVVLMSPLPHADAERQTRFAETLAAIRAASAVKASLLADELEGLVKRTRQTSQS